MGVGHAGEAGGMALHTKMLLGFAVGAVAGGVAFSFGQTVDAEGVTQAAPWLATTLKWVTQPVGSIFLNLLFMLVLPLVFSALVLGVVEIGDPKALGRIGGKTLAFILAVTGIAVTIGLVAVNLFQPGVGIDPAVAQKLIAESSSQAAGIVERGEAASAMQVLLSIVPRNPLQAGVEGNLIGVMFFALLFGIAAATLKTDGVRTFVGTLQGVYDITLLLINKVIQLAPYAVAALLFNLIAVKGFAGLLPLAKFVAVAVGALAVHLFVVFPLLLWFVGRMNPIVFFKKVEPVILTAFSTSSSSATLPTSAARGRGGAGHAEAHRPLRLHARRHRQHERHGPVRGRGGAVPRAVLRHRAGPWPAGAGAADVHPRRHRRGRRARWLAAGDRLDPRDVRHPARRHRADPRRRPLHRHVSDDGQRHRRPRGHRGGVARRAAGPGRRRRRQGRLRPLPAPPRAFKGDGAAPAVGQ